MVKIQIKKQYKVWKCYSLNLEESLDPVPSIFATLILHQEKGVDRMLISAAALTYQEGGSMTWCQLMMEVSPKCEKNRNKIFNLEAGNFWARYINGNIIGFLSWGEKVTQQQQFSFFFLVPRCMYLIFFYQ